MIEKDATEMCKRISADEEFIGLGRKERTWIAAPIASDQIREHEDEEEEEEGEAVGNKESLEEMQKDLGKE